MPSPIKITISNISEIRAAFNQAPALMVKHLNTAIRKTAIIIQGKSMRNTPVLTGRLRASTSSEFSNLKAIVGTHTNYDMYVHEGTRFMRGRPYLRQAVEDSTSEVDEFFTKAVDDVLKDIGERV